ASGTDISYSLPEEIDGMKITWKESKEPVYPLILIAGLCVLLGIWYGTDRDLKKRYEERNRRMIMDYADFVSKLQILLSSGSTIRRSLERMADDYKNSREKGGRRKYVYEELLLCTRKLGDGMGEASCLEFFGNRCGLSCYKKLTALLIQNLRKGTDSLIEAMDNEVRTAFEERKAAARKAGEEAQTKLMLPMMLMLSVVMIIIMVPAYLSFGGM
ncbi:MAG: type II secretion system F family protein, partial [Lachnospiraceae bacterium]|nr:type II secretion system F family protein [Lachnospiraceae bacterium]